MIGNMEVYATHDRVNEGRPVTYRRTYAGTRAEILEKYIDFLFDMEKAGYFIVTKTITIK